MEKGPLHSPHPSENAKTLEPNLGHFWLLWLSYGTGKWCVGETRPKSNEPSLTWVMARAVFATCGPDCNEPGLTQVKCGPHYVDLWLSFGSHTRPEWTLSFKAKCRPWIELRLSVSPVVCCFYEDQGVSALNGLHESQTDTNAQPGCPDTKWQETCPLKTLIE